MTWQSFIDRIDSVNYAFAYIDPSSYQVVTMDGSVPTSLFSDITNLKSIKQDLDVFVSIGGWYVARMTTHLALH
jgi:chitinase